MTGSAPEPRSGSDTRNLCHPSRSCQLAGLSPAASESVRRLSSNSGFSTFRMFWHEVYASPAAPRSSSSAHGLDQIEPENVGVDLGPIGFRCGNRYVARFLGEMRRLGAGPKTTRPFTIRESLRPNGAAWPCPVQDRPWFIVAEDFHR